MTEYRYPSIEGGNEFVAETLRAMLPLFVIKDNNTDATSDTTFNDDPELLLSGFKANGIYEVEFVVKFAGDNSGNIKTNWTVPTGASGNRLCIGPGSSASNSSADNISVRMGVHGVATSVVYSCTRDSTGLSVWCWERGIIVLGANDGSIALSWAQATSFATETRVTTQSWGKATRLA